MSGEFLTAKFLRYNNQVTTNFNDLTIFDQKTSLDC